MNYKKMKKEILDVQKFHETYLAPVGNQPQLIPQERYNLRFNLMQEELNEYMQACKNNDLIEVADALTDLLYVTFGTIVEHGLQDKAEEIFEEVQKSNLSKLDENGKPIFREDGKVLKGPNFFKPNLKQFFEKN